MYELGESSRTITRNQNFKSQDDLQQSKSRDFQEPERCSCCFTLRGVAISTIAVLLVVGILVLVLDFTIVEVYGKTNSFQIVQDGGTLEAEKYSQVYNRDLKIIDLNNVEVNVTTLQTTIGKTIKVEVIRLRNLKLKGRLPNTFRDIGDYQPALKEFTFELNQPIGPADDFQLDDCDECIVESADILGSLEAIRQIRCLPSMLFYVNTPLTAGEIKMNSKMAQANLRLTVLGRNLLTFQPKSKALATMFRDCEAPINIILAAKPIQIQKLAFSNCGNLNATSLMTWITTWNVTHLILDKVKVTGLSSGQRLSQIFENSTSLQELVIKTEPFKKRNWTNDNHSYDVFNIMFDDFPKSLKILVLSGVEIIRSNDTSSSSTKPELQLESLMLNQVTFQDLETLNKFPRGIQFQNFAYRQLAVLSTYEQKFQEDQEFIRQEEADNSRSLGFISRVMEGSGRIWMENPFYRINGIHEEFIRRLPSYGPSAVRYQEFARAEFRRLLQRELISWRKWLSKKGIDSTILLRNYPTFTFVKNDNGVRGEDSWRFELEDKSSSDNENAHVWFRFMRMGTFLREDLWDKVKW